MPQRFLRPGITNSERWNSVGFDCQSFYIRILTHVDDYGRFDGRPAVLHGHCFSVWNEQNPGNEVNLQQVERMLQQLADKKLVEWYEQDGKKVIQLVQWQERIRENTKSKWPERTEVAASCSKLLLPSPSPSPSPAPLCPAKSYSADSRVLIHWLNQESGRSFREVSSSLDIIEARLNEPDVTLEGCKAMISRQCKLWKGDPKMCEFLRPETLFNKTKFNSYYASRNLPIQNANPNSNPAQRVDRSIGTLNEGTSHLYAGLGCVAKPSDVQ